MNSPLVSVVMASFNSSKFIIDSIDSVLTQSYRNLELIIVDDGSTDSTVELILGKQKQDPRIFFYQLKHSGNPSIPRNHGLKNAKGEYVAFIDSDDLWTKRKIEIQIKAFKVNPKFSFLYGASVSFGDVNMLSSKYELLPLPFRAAENHHQLLTIGNTIPLSSVMARKDLLLQVNGFDEDPQLKVEDYDLWIRLSEKSDFKFICALLVYYRVHSNQFSLNWQEQSRRLNYLAIKRNLNLPEHNRLRDKGLVIKILRNLLHYFFYLLLKIRGMFF